MIFDSSFIGNSLGVRRYALVFREQPNSPARCISVHQCPLVFIGGLVLMSAA